MMVVCSGLFDAGDRTNLIGDTRVHFPFRPLVLVSAKAGETDY